METLWQDIKYGARMLARKPGFTIVAVLTLALGIGANTAIFSVVNSVLFQPLPYKNPERLVRLYENKLPQWNSFSVSPQNADDWRKQNTVFESLAPYSFQAANLTGGETPQRVDTLWVPPGFFQLLGASPLIGRTFLEDEDLPGQRDVVVLGYGFWQRTFGGRESVLNESILLNGTPTTVIGVMPPGFQYPDSDYELWVPYPRDPAEMGRRGQHFLGVIARLKPGVTFDQAQAGMDSIATGLAAEYPETNTGWGVTLVPLHEWAVSDVKSTLLVLWGAVGFVVLIACANVANLLLARATSREKEVAIRAALGAGRTRIVRQLLTENILLATLGGTLGMLLAYGGMQPLLAMSGDSLPRAEEVALDSTVLLFALGLSLFPGILFGLLPAWQATRGELNNSLREGGRRSSGTGSIRLRGVLIISEVALALVLLVGAGLMIRSLSSLIQMDPGFDPYNLLTFRVSLPGSDYESQEQVTAFFDQLLADLNTLPEVESAGMVIRMPPSGGWWINTFAIEGRPPAEPGQRTSTRFRPVSPDFFPMMRIPMVEGRGFTEFDRASAQRVAVVSQAMGKKFWPGENPIGQRMHFYDNRDGDPNWYTVVGIAGDILDDGLDNEPVAAAYLPYAQLAFTLRTMDLAVRTHTSPLNVAGAVRGKVLALDNSLPVFDLTTMENTLADTLAQRRFSMLLLGLFAAVAMLLAAVGIYGVINYSVSQRTHEIGIRMALGAQTGDVLKMIFRQAMALILVGIAIGLGAALGLTRFLESQLFGVTSRDPVTLFAVPLLLTAVAFLACYVPARRATYE
jgi:putative ABC transport system permease protein